MTVQELIECLQKIENKELPVAIKIKDQESTELDISIIHSSGLGQVLVIEDYT